MTMLPAEWPLLCVVLALLVVGVLASRGSDPVRRVRGRLWLALGVFGGALLASWWVSLQVPSLLGLPIVVGPGAAAALGILVFSVLPWRSPDPATTRRSAVLRVRSAGQVVSGGALVLPIVLLAVLVIALGVSGVTADASGDAAGRAFTATEPGVSASAGPYPGWYYGVPVLVTTAVLVTAVAVGVRRTVLLPAVSEDPATDDRWRRTVGGTLGAIAAAGLLLYLAGVLWAAGAAWHVLVQLGHDDVAPLGVAQSAVSGLSALAAVVLLVRSVIRVAHLGRTITSPRVPA